MKPYANNPRRISKQRHERLTDTLARLGDLGGIVHNLETDEVIGGNQRMTVFKNGEPTIVEQYDAPDEQGTVAHGFIVWRGHKFAYRQVRWDAATAAEANIAANLGAGEWDWDALSGWDAGDLQSWGFDTELLRDWNTGAAALDALLKSEEEPPADDPGAQIDRAEELREKWGVNTGDLWKLGEHRLVCGDCTDAAVVARVMGGEKAALMVTDPPYGVEYDPNWRNEAAEKGLISYAARRVGKVTNDDRVDWSEAYRLFTGDVAYTWSPPGDPVILTGQALQGAGFEIRNQIIWRKPHLPISRGHYSYQHEPCWYGVKKGGTAHWIGGFSASTVWDISLDKNVEGGHSTQKPLECMARPIRNHEGDVYDPFLGSGTTMVAAQRLGRRCFGIEIDPGYCAVVLERMSGLGITPELVKHGD